MKEEKEKKSQNKKRFSQLIPPSSFTSTTVRPPPYTHGTILSLEASQNKISTSRGIGTNVTLVTKDSNRRFPLYTFTVSRSKRGNSVVIIRNKGEERCLGESGLNWAVMTGLDFEPRCIYSSLWVNGAWLTLRVCTVSDGNLSDCEHQLNHAWLASPEHHFKGKRLIQEITLSSYWLSTSGHRLQEQLNDCYNATSTKNPSSKSSTTSFCITEW